ncbi:MAG: DsbA family protein [Actinomycetes bacterium]
MAQTTLPGTVAVWGDIACPWASLAVHRLHAARTRLGLDDQVRIDLRAFPLELVNGRCTPKRTIDAEVAAIGAHEPALAWQSWQRRVDEYPSSVLIALSAVQAAKDESVGGLRASEEIDHALRKAFYRDSRPIGQWTEVFEVAMSCSGLDTDALTEVMLSGAGLRAVVEQHDFAERNDVKGSPHLFCPDGSDFHNPGISMKWTKEQGRGFLVIEKDDPSIYDELLHRAVA